MPARIWYVATTGNDSTGDGTIGNPFATPLPACFGGAFAAASGDTITLAAGTYTMNANAIFIPNGVEMMGAGMGVTVVKNGTIQASYHTNPVCAVTPGSATNTHDFTIDTTGAPSGVGKPFGYQRDLSGNASFDTPVTPTTFIASNLELIGDADGFYFQWNGVEDNGDTNTPPAIAGTMTNCRATTKFDAYASLCSWTPSGSTLTLESWNGLVLSAVSVTLTANGTSAGNNITKRAVSCFAGSLTLSNSVLVAIGTKLTGTPYTAAIKADSFGHVIGNTVTLSASAPLGNVYLADNANGTNSSIILNAPKFANQGTIHGSLTITGAISWTPVLGSTLPLI